MTSEKKSDGVNPVHCVVPAQPGWFVAWYNPPNGERDELFYLDPIIAWAIDRHWYDTEKFSGEWTTFTEPILAASARGELNDLSTAIKSPEGRFVFWQDEMTAESEAEALELARKRYAFELEKKRLKREAVKEAAE
jgi:hypothetical protein